LTLPGLELQPLGVQHVANHYTDCAIPATYIPCYNHLLINVKKNSLTVVMNTIHADVSEERANFMLRDEVCSYNIDNFF
jgi:hypothetical protein